VSLEDGVSDIDEGLLNEELLLDFGSQEMSADEIVESFSSGCPAGWSMSVDGCCSHFERVIVAKSAFGSATGEMAFGGA
jgi:hypothetical protein